MQPASGRPGAVTAVAVLAIILGSLIVLCGGWNIIARFINFGVSTPTLDQIKTDPTLVTLTFVTAGLYLLLGILMLAGGIAALSLKPAGRTLLITASILAIVVFVSTTILQLTYLAPIQKRVIEESIRYQETTMGKKSPLTADAMYRLGMIFNAVIGGIFLVGVPIVFMALLNKRNVVEAFRRGPTPTDQSPGTGYYQP